MNTPARRDGTPDRRKRSDQPVRGGAARDAGTRGAARGTERGASRGDYRGSAQGSAQRGTQSAPGYRGSASSATPRGAAYRGNSQDGNAYRGDARAGSRNADAQGGNAYRGRTEGDSYRGRTDAAKGGTAQRGNSQGGNTSRATGRGPAQGATQWGAGGIPQRRATQPAPTGKKKNPKPQRQTTSAPHLSNAKPAKRQHTEPAVSEGHVKMPWGEGERLQKVLAKAGVASRRAAEEMIAQGRVEVDGAIVVEQGLRIDPQVAVVRVDGTRVMVREELVHVVLNKPKGWQSTMSDDLGRPCVGDIVAERIAAGQRLFHVGRLDADTEGLLLLTNDGDLAHRLMHPSFQVSKTYLATVNGEVHKSIGKKLKDGIELEDGPAKVDSFQVLELGEGRSLVKLVLHEGRKHIVRRLLDAVGHPVNRLVRTNIGPVALGDQRPGTLRVLGRSEIGKLYEAVSL
ncbi:pseudouridine synthase [Nocardia altamirensis]|uniref:pseudouridine synthase n=1 Tax=Nocardia altamirensis TaxID=472158 RepID=UPI0009FF30AF|nr:pseudouridine synthase [Nocardia altamirensis]